jgi:hypothetical protein
MSAKGGRRPGSAREGGIIFYILLFFQLWQPPDIVRCFPFYLLDKRFRKNGFFIMWGIVHERGKGGPGEGP